MRVLVTNSTIAGHRGARSVTRDLLTGLLRAGHRPMLFSLNLGPLADQLRAQSIPVTDDIQSINEPPDIIHGQHFSVTTLAIARFPGAPAIFVCHGFDSWQDAPPRLPQIRRYAAISDGFRDRLTVEGGIDPGIARVVLNAVDLDRFALGPPLPAKPSRALAFAKNTGHLPAVEAACQARGIELEMVGGAVGKVVEPHKVMGDYDVVFGSGLTAIEAMATGRAVIVCDGRGLAGFADTNRYQAWRRENFGLRALRQPNTPEAMAGELDRYDADQAAEVSARVRAEAGIPAWIATWETLYAEAIGDHRARPANADTAARALAGHFQAWSSKPGPGFPWLVERAELIERAEAARLGLSALAPGRATSAADRGMIELHGFAPAEAWGAWSTRARCSVALRVQSVVKRLVLHYRIHFPPGRDRFDFTVMANGLPLEGWTDKAGAESYQRRLDLPEDTVDETGRLWLTFTTTAPRSPAEDGISADLKPLGFGLSSVQAEA